MSGSGAIAAGADFWQDRFNGAQKAVGGIIERHLAVGPCRVRLLFAGPALLPTLLPALEPRLVPLPDGEPHLTIHLWDSASTGVAVVPHPDAPPGTRTAGTNGSVVVARHEPITREIRVLLMEKGQAWWQAPDAARLHYYTRGSPLRELLHAALKRAGMALLHAGAVGFPDGGVLMVGPGGSGKSTSTLACLESGLGFVSEDYTAMTLGVTPEACALYTSAKVNDDTLGWLPGLTSRGSRCRDSAEEKNLLFLHRIRSERMLGRCPIRAAFIVGRNSGPGTAILPASRGETLKALAPSTLIQLRTAGGLQLAELGQLLRGLSCHRLLAGSDLNTIPRSIIQFLRPS
jgi:hypothetical protein